MARLHSGRGLYTPLEGTRGIARLDRAFDLVYETNGVVRKIRDAIRAGRLPKESALAPLEEATIKGMIAQADAALVTIAAQAREDAIQVDSRGVPAMIAPAGTEPTRDLTLAAIASDSRSSLVCRHMRAHDHGFWWVVNDAARRHQRPRGDSKTDHGVPTEQRDGEFVPSRREVC